MRPLRKAKPVNPKIAKQLAKLALMGLGSLLIGTIIKAEKKLEQRIDDHYAEPETEQPAN